MRSFTNASHSRRSPSIRSPSLFEGTPSSSLSPRSAWSNWKRTCLDRRFILKLLIVALVAWYEVGTFYSHATKRSTCFAPPDAEQRPGSEAGFNVLVATDPQLLDMRQSYEGRNPILKWLSIEITHRFMRKSWKFLTTRASALDAVVWNGDLLDNGRDMADPQEYSRYTRMFHQFFPLPRQRQHQLADSSSSERLDPPIPVVYVSGNHDVTLHPTTSNETSRSRFEQSFGSLYGERELKGFNLVWIDSIALLEQSFWNPAPPSSDINDPREAQFKKMKTWLEELGERKRNDPDGQEPPRILFTHVPLFRPAGTTCGTDREHSSGGASEIRDEFGRGYQNLVGKAETEWLLDQVQPVKVFSGDDHDYCFVRHDREEGSRLNTTETTVKSFSMAMGVSYPGYTILTLYPPSSTNGEGPTFGEQSCLLPSQLGIYLHVYLPLAATLFVALLGPKLVKVAKRWVKRIRKAIKRRSRPTTTLPQIRRRGSQLRWKRGGGTGTRGGGGGEKAGEQDREDDEEESLVFPSTFGGGGEYGYSANLGGPEDGATGGNVGEPISNRPSPLRREYVDDGASESDSDDDTSEDESGGDGARRGGARRNRRPSKVRRVSRVWLWDKDSPSSSLLSTPRLSLTTASSNGLPRYTSAPSYDDDFGGAYDDDPYSIAARIRDISHRVASRLSQNSLIVPLIRVVRPLVRLVRTVVFIVLGKPLELLTRWFGRDKGLAKAVRDALWEFWDLTSLGIALWVVVWIWVGL
ncbi:hypothetical protein JCM3766R1_006067 [Sporobolomyces carnicolor]